MGRSLCCDHEVWHRLRPDARFRLAVSLALLVAPWFVMQPALGLGFMAARTPKPGAVRAVNVSVHTVFGIGLYLGAIGSAWLARVA